MEYKAAPEPEAKGADERDMRDPRGWYLWWPGGQGEEGAICPRRSFGARIDGSVNLKQEKPTKM
jgi:hypothetical protein